MKPVSVILPVYNEKECLVPIITAINRDFCPEEIIVVDDSSSDGTSDLIIKAKKKFSNVFSISNSPPLGLAASIQKGIDYAKCQIVAWMDADFSHPPEVLNQLYKDMYRSDIAVGSWLAPGGKDERRKKQAVVFSIIINKICLFLFGNKIHTYTSGFLMVRKKVFKNFRLSGDYGEYCIDFLVRNIRRKKRIIEVPFTCVSRKAGVSKTTKNAFVFLNFCFKYLYTIIRLIFSFK